MTFGSDRWKELQGKRILFEFVYPNETVGPLEAYVNSLSTSGNYIMLQVVGWDWPTWRRLDNVSFLEVIDQ